MSKKVVNKILSQTVKYSVMTKNDIDQSSTLVSKNFIQREALCLHTAVKFNQFKYLANYLLNSDRLNKSIIARCQQSSKVVGVLINECAENEFQFNQQMGQGLKQMLQFSFQLQNEMINLLQVNRSEIFTMCWLAVSQEYEGVGIALKLMKESISLAKKLNFKYIISQLTSPLTQHLWKNKLKFGYKQHLLNCQQGKGHFLQNCQYQDKILIGVQKLDQLIL